MKKLKTVKKLAKDMIPEVNYKKIPKQKIFKKATLFGVSKIIGGPYLEVLGFLFNRTKKTVLSYAGSYAYESFFRSTFAKQKINIIPITILSLIIRSIFNFLLLYRLRFDIWYLDFIISVIVTIIITLTSPLFYKSIAVHDEVFMKYTNVFIDNFLGENGLEYLENIKNKLLFSSGIASVIVLNFMTIRSLQEIIIHSLITGFITDKLQKWLDRNKMVRLYYGMGPTDPVNCMVLGPHNFMNVAYKLINYCHTDNRIILGSKPKRAAIIKVSDIKFNSDKGNNNIIKSDNKSDNICDKEKITLLNIIDDYMV